MPIVQARSTRDPTRPRRRSSKRPCPQGLSASPYAVRYLNHPLRAKESTHYITQSLELLEEIQKTGDIFFPRQFITAVLSGHQSPTAAHYVKKFLQEHPHFPYRLKNKVLMASDLLFATQQP
ncbi:MAG: hypothetical protein ACKOZZ_15210 [Bacteroidota bacterium]